MSEGHIKTASCLWYVQPLDYSMVVKEERFLTSVFISCSCCHILLSYDYRVRWYFIY